MDWVKLFALLVAVFSLAVIAQGTRKKIRIHLPQKVKHIHHHKKIYITNHPASSQYAPAYLPTAEGAVAVPTTVALPTVAGLVPLKSMQLYDERNLPPLQGVSPAASKLLPLYRARGYYGPTPEWEEQEFDLVPPPEHLGATAAAAVLPSAFSAPSAPEANNIYTPKRIKIVKGKPVRKTKIIRKRKPNKRIIIQEPPREEEQTPSVSTFHEQFYSDLEGAGTIKKIKKPKRVEKIIDGDTEHIHTYSEEHIHKLVFEDGPKITGVAGIDPESSMSALAASHPLVPLKNSQSLLALDNSDFGAPFGDLNPVGGSFGTPSQLEFAAYNPRDVTHDHIFHDHGELPDNIDITKENIARPPKVSYNSQGLKINGATIKSRPKNKWKAPKPTRPTPPIDFSYYENMYSPPTRTRKHPRHHNAPHKYFEESSESSIDDFRPVPNFRYKDYKPKIKNNGYHGYGRPSSFRVGQESVPVPFSTASSLIIDDSFNPVKHSFAGIKPSTIGFANYKDPFTSFKDIYTNNFEYDTYASPSNVFNKDNKINNQSPWPLQGNKKKKSISTQNISFGGQDHKTVVDHMADSSNVQSSKEALMHPSSSVQTFEEFNIHKSDESATPSMEYTITEHSPAHDYYTAMALKAFHEDPMSLPQASNTNFQIVEAPSPSTPTSIPMATTPRPTPTFFTIPSPSETSTTVQTRTNSQIGKIAKRIRMRSKPTPSISETRPTLSYSNNDDDRGRVRSRTTEEDRRDALHRLEQEYQRSRRVRSNIQEKRHISNLEGHPTAASQFKYGDKL